MVKIRFIPPRPNSELYTFFRPGQSMVNFFVSGGQSTPIMLFYALDGHRLCVIDDFLYGDYKILNWTEQYQTSSFIFSFTLLYHRAQGKKCRTDRVISLDLLLFKKEIGRIWAAMALGPRLLQSCVELGNIGNN